MPRGRPKARLIVAPPERKALQRWARRRKTAPALALRARIVLECSKGRSNAEVAAELGVTPQTAGKWRRRFIEKRLDGLLDEPRPGAPRRITDADVELVVMKTLEGSPRGATHWSTRSLAQATGIGSTSVHRLWRSFGLKPHPSQTLQLPDDPLFVEKVQDIVGLYLSPPDRAAVLCADEERRIPALDGGQPPRPGQAERRTPDSARHGAKSLFAALGTRTEEASGARHRRPPAREFLRFLQRIDAEVPADLELHLILGNYSTHKTPAILRWLVRRPRFHLHFTPSAASWLDLVERWFGLLGKRGVRRGSQRGTRELEATIRAYLAVHAKHPKPFVWTKTAGAMPRPRSKKLPASGAPLKGPEPSP